jgi:hypothetical protein
MSLTDDKINAILILEVLGKPPEHLKETLGKIADAIGNEKDVEIKNKKINDAVEMPNKKGYYTSFAEIEVETKAIIQLIGLMFRYMPAHIEILSPENLKLNNNELGELLNEVVRRLHGYDEIARMMQLEKKIIEKNFKQLLEKYPEAKKELKEVSEKSKPKDKK